MSGNGWGKDNGGLKRLALQIAVQLPKDPRAALECLDLTKTLVRSFLLKPEASCKD